MGVTSSSKRRRDKLRKEKFLAKFGRDPLLVPIPFPEPGQSPSPVALGAPIHTAISTAFIMQAEEMVHETKRLCHQHDCSAKEAEKADRERDRLCT